MRLSYDFEQYEPPKLTEQSLNAVLQKRRDVRRMLLFAAASNLILLSLAMLALVVAPYSILVSIICLVLLGTYLSGSGILTFLLTKKLIKRYGEFTAVPFKLNA